MGLDQQTRSRSGALAQRERLLLRSALKPGEYLAPRPLAEPAARASSLAGATSATFPGG